MTSQKRAIPELHFLEPAKKCKFESKKENIPPELDNCEVSEEKLTKHHEKHTPKKCIQYAEEDPVTQNTNFKLLTAVAASQNYENCNTPRSRKKDQSGFFSNVEKILHKIEESGYRVNRKEKSLSKICTRFLAIYPPKPDKDSNIIVSLDEAVGKLGVERRRLYDIVNVFESIEMLKKLSKNKYLWFGEKYLLSALQKIKSAARKENVLTKLQYVLEQEKNMPVLKLSCILDDVEDFRKKFEIRNSTCNLRFQTSPVPELRKEKSLAIMSQKFLMLFLVSSSKIISLGVAAKVMNGFQKTEKAAQIKTQIRRLYDIANVLSSIGLIQKDVTSYANGRKPVFRYTGPDVKEFPEESNSESMVVNGSKGLNSNGKSRSLVRHSSFQEICAVAEMEHKKLCLRENANSAPPFEKNLFGNSKASTQTSFSNLNLHHKTEAENIKIEDSELNSTNNYVKNDHRKGAFQNIQPKVSSEDMAKSHTKPFTLQGLSNLKVINVPKQMLTSNGSYFILNPTSNDDSKTKNSVGTLLLISPLPGAKSTEITINKIASEKISTSKTVNLSQLKGDTVLQSLKASSSNGQIAVRQFDGFAKLSNSDSPRRNILKIIEKAEAMEMAAKQDVSKNVHLNGTESNESSGIGSSRNNSPSSSVTNCESPISIPSGNVTPVTTVSSDFSFPSNTEIDSVLKIIEKQINADFSGITKHLQKENADNQGERPSGIKIIFPRKKLLPLKNTPLEDIQNLHLSNCSNDSVNLEVSEILKDKKLGENTGRFKPFLIDEKTILSPIKSKKLIKTIVTPSPFITPPYVPTDSDFVFNNLVLNCQTNGDDNHQYSDT